MSEHQFIVGRSRTGYLQYTLQINTTGIEGDSLKAAASYLIDHVHVIYNKFPEMEEEVMWPIVFKVDEKFTISESTFWKHVFDSIPDGFQYLEKYINKLTGLSKVTEFNTLLMSNEYQFHGGLAFNQFWIWCIEGPLIDNKLTNKAVKLFSLWLVHNDLGFETSEDDCINMIFSHLKHLEHKTIATLLAQRINNGQSYEKDFDYLANVLVRHNSKTDCCLLKEVINQLCNNELYFDSALERESTIYELSAVMYGSNERCTNEVMDYARKITKEDLVPAFEHQIKNINYFRQIGDIYWQNFTSQERYIDTSFHLFDTHTKKWIDYSEREDD